jgi:tetratricopeptide (TPR) repeat protein
LRLNLNLTDSSWTLKAGAAPMVTHTPAEAASVLMKRGIALLSGGDVDELAAALDCFDQALAIRQALPPNADPWQDYVLAASWMNRGDVLIRMGGLANLAGAIRSFDEALAVMKNVPLDANPLFGRRMAIAWINRGLALQEQGDPQALEDARKSFEAGIHVLKAREDQNQVAACGWMNLANVLMRAEPAQATKARASAERAIAMRAKEEHTDIVSAETALKARHILCQAIAEIIADAKIGRVENAEAAMAAAESGLKVIRRWEERGERRFRPLARQFFLFGMTLAQQYHPDQIATFIAAGLPAIGDGADPESIAIHEAAVDALARAWRTLEKEGFTAINTPRLDQWIETLRALRSTDSRLRDLRAAAAMAKSEAVAK